MCIRVSLPIGILACAAMLAPAQTVTGTVEGRVYDPSGAVVSTAKLRAKGTTTGISRTAEANAEGFFQFAYMPLGAYEVTVEASGFQSQSRVATVTLNRATVVDFALKLSGTQETVTVTEAAPVIVTSSGQINRSLEDRTINAIPVPGRNFLTLAILLPGFQTNPTSGQNNPTLSSGSSVSLNGTGTRGTTFQTDGVANDDYSENQNRQGVNISTIKEFQIVTNSFAAEFGRGAGAVVLVQTKSGTNAHHGEGYWLTSNSALNARSYFANEAGSRVNPATGKLEPVVPKTASKSHRPGAAVGGPILANKLFYFGSYERFYAPGSVTSTISLLPKEFRTPRVDPQLPDAAARRQWIQDIIDRYPDVAPNNTVNNPNGYTASVGRNYHTDDVSGRADYNLNEKNFLYTRYQLSTFFIKTDELYRGFNAKQDHRHQNLGLTWTHLYSPRVSGEFRFGFGRRRMLVTLNDGDKVPIVIWNITYAPSQLGNASAYPLKRFQNDFQYVYNVSAQLGSRHTLKLGTDTRRIQLNDRIENYHRGNWNFSSTGQYNALENFVRGVVQSYIQGFGPEYNGYRTTEVNLYVQDDFRATPDLTLNLGARFEHVGKPGEVNNLMDLGYASDRYFEPRFGFAYTPRGRGGLLARITGGPGQSVIRGGFGMAHGRIFQSLFSQIGASTRFNPPNGAVVSRSDPDMSVANPLAGFTFRPGPPASQVSLASIDPGLRMPYTMQWNLTLERQLPWTSGLSVSYIGNRGIGFLQYYGLNRAQFPVVSTVPASYPGQNFPGVLFDKVDANLFNTNPAPGFISLSQSRTAARRKDGRYSGILYATNGSWSYYSAMQAQYTKRMTSGLMFQAGYSWSKNIDTGSEATFVGTGDTNIVISEKDGARSMRGLSRLDQPHRFVVSYNYQFPFFKSQEGWLGRVAGGWEMSGVATFAAGNPITVVLGYDLNADAIGSDRPFLVDPSAHGRSFDNARINPATGRQYAMDAVPVSAFFPNQDVAATRNWPWYPGTGLVASAGRNIFRIQGQNNWDVAFVKKTKILGKDSPHLIEFRAEMFNFFNRVQFGFPSNGLVDTGVVGWRINPLFGRITALNNSPRNMQMILKYVF